MLGKRFATRMNSFASGASAYWTDLSGKPSLAQMVRRAATGEGLSELDLNYPGHVEDDPKIVAGMVCDCGLEVSGLAMRYYTNPAYKHGAFTNPDPVVRREAIDLNKRGIDAAAHAIYANEQPAFAAAMILRHSKLLGLHLNDGYAKRDDGLIVGAVHKQATLELLREVKRGGFDGAICFDTFPDASGLDPVAECAANIRTVRRMLNAVDRMEGDNALADAQSCQDPVEAREIARVALAKATASGL